MTQAVGWVLTVPSCKPLPQRVLAAQQAWYSLPRSWLPPCADPAWAAHCSNPHLRSPSHTG